MSLDGAVPEDEMALEGVEPEDGMGLADMEPEDEMSLADAAEEEGPKEEALPEGGAFGEEPKEGGADEE